MLVAGKGLSMRLAICRKEYKQGAGVVFISEKFLLYILLLQNHTLKCKRIFRETELYISLLAGFDSWKPEG